MRRTDRIRKLQASRGSSPAYLLNFLRNFAAPARLMHASIRAFRSDETLLRQSMRQYVIGIASCLETYYRDLYVALLQADQQLVRRPFERDRRASRLTKLRAAGPDDIPEAEWAAELAKFQNLLGIDQALSELLEPLGYVQALTSTDFPCVIPSRRDDLACLRLWPEWQDQFSSVFDHRHEFVHDANKPCTLAPAEMARIESTALLVPQLTSVLMARQLSATAPLLAMEGVPTILLVEDLVAGDWQVEAAAM